MYLVRRLEHCLESVLGEFQIADMGEYSYRQLHGPNRQHCSGAAAAVQLGRLLTDIIDDLIPQLGWKSRHGTPKSFSVRILGFWGIYPYQLCFDPVVYVVTRLCFLKCQQGLYIFFLFYRQVSLKDRVL